MTGVQTCALPIYTDEILAKDVPKVAYQIANTKDSSLSQYDMIKALELSQAAFLSLKGYCQKKGILFLSTPFDFGSLHFLVDQAEIACIKMASNEITNGPLLLEAAATQKPIILSTGMSTLDDIEDALSLLAFGYTRDLKEVTNKAQFKKAYHSQIGQQALKEKVSILHCTSEYPAPYNHVNLRVLKTLSEKFGLTVGYSDHTLGIEVSIAAVALGARIIEKHFTISRDLEGPDHLASLVPEELKSLVEGIRHVEQALGSGVKQPTETELEHLKIMRRSIVARNNITVGEIFSTHNITAKQPAAGISPMEYWEYLGKIAQRNYKKDEVIS